MSTAAQIKAEKPELVTFDAEGVELSGHLRIPINIAEPLPALLFTGPFSGVKEQVAGHYAEALSQAGYVTLAFDHRNFGASAGPRRQHEDPAGKLADLRAATSYLATHDQVDATRLGCVGICLGGGYALRHSAFDRRIKASALIAGGYNDPKQMRDGMGAENYYSLMKTMAEVAQQEYASGEVEYLKAVSDIEGEEAAMGGAEPFEYYGTERSSSAGWQNQVTRLSIRELLSFDAAIGADFIDPTPTLFVHGRNDLYCTPEGAQSTFDRVQGTKDLAWLETSNHIDLYDQPKYVGPAVDRVQEWMAAHL